MQGSQIESGTRTSLKSSVPRGQQDTFDSGETDGLAATRFVGTYVGYHHWEQIL